MTTEQQKLLAELDGLRDQIQKKHFLNVHFRAFRLAWDAWQEHVRQNAVGGSREAGSPGGAVLDNERDGKMTLSRPRARTWPGTTTAHERHR